MAELTHSKSNMERLEEAMAKLASNYLHVTKKLDDLLQRVATLKCPSIAYTFFLFYRTYTKPTTYSSP